MGFELILTILIGCCIGSFINVLVYRLPRRLSIILPSSFCISCKRNISWRDNIPILGWLILKGKCRYCKTPISLRYPFLEFFTALLFTLNIYSNPTNFELYPSIFTNISGSFLLLILIPLTILDIKYLWLPKSLCIFGICGGLLNSLIYGLYYSNYHYALLKEHILAAIIGISLFRLISYISQRIFKKPALGLGDSNLVAMVGAWLGLEGMIITIFLTFITAGIYVLVGLTLSQLHPGQEIPLGPFIIFNGYSIWFLGNQYFFNLYYLLINLIYN
tara:strand:- start:641 stop:1465 length:825 start_codon:yes stop_codon:yes gene_type:complete